MASKVHKTPRERAEEMAREAKRLEREAAELVKTALRLRMAAGAIDGRFKPRVGSRNGRG